MATRLVFFARHCVLVFFCLGFGLGFRVLESQGNQHLLQYPGGLQNAFHVIVRVQRTCSSMIIHCVDVKLIEIRHAGGGEVLCHLVEHAEVKRKTTCTNKHPFQIGSIDVRQQCK